MTSIVSLAGQKVFGFIVRQDPGVRLRVMSREWESLCLTEGQTVRFVWAGQVDSTLLIGAVMPGDPGNTWVYLTRPIT